MESMGRSPEPPFIHSGLNAEIVDLCQRSDRSVGQVAKDFDLIETAVHEWSGRLSMTPEPPGPPDQQGIDRSWPSCGGRRADAWAISERSSMLT